MAWLAPYRVIDLTDERGLLAGQMLGKLGADVIQVEPPGGSTARAVGPFDDAGRSCYWSAYAAAKRGVSLDIANPAGREILLSLVAGADFLIESAAPGHLASISLDHSTLMTRNPRLIHVSITAFGSSGPKAGYAASDLVLWAAGGPLHPHRDGDGPPLRMSAPQAWLHAAADGAGGALVAHFARLRSGAGQHVDISAQQSVAQATLSSITAAAVGDTTFATEMRARAAAGAGVKWRASDGLVELMLPAGPAMGSWSNNLFNLMRREAALPAALQDWDWATLPARMETGEIGPDHVAAARAAVADFLALHTKRELGEMAMANKILMAPCNTMSDLLESPHLAFRELFAAVGESEVRRTLPWAFAKGPVGMFAEPRGAPGLGQHNAEVYGDLLGLSADRLDALRVEGVI